MFFTRVSITYHTRETFQGVSIVNSSDVAVKGIRFPSPTLFRGSYSSPGLPFTHVTEEGRGSG